VVAKYKNRIISWIMVGTLVISFLVLLLFGYWRFYPYKTFRVNSVTLMNYSVEQGGHLAVMLDYDRYTDITSKSYRHFVDGITFATPPFEGIGEQGHYNRFVEVDVPITLPPGSYTLKTFSDFKMNPIRHVSNSWETTTFTVTPKYHDEATEPTPK
jgi:hypothetical protein